MTGILSSISFIGFFDLEITCYCYKFIWFVNLFSCAICADSSFQEKHPKFLDFLKKSCTKLMKILIAFQQRHPYSFGDQSVIGPVVDFCLNKITNPEPDVLSFEIFLIQCMVMMKSVLECKEYKPFLSGRVMDDNRVLLQDVKKNVSSVVAGFLASLLPSERVVLLCNILIRR